MYLRILAQICRKSAIILKKMQYCRFCLILFNYVITKLQKHQWTVQLVFCSFLKVSRSVCLWVWLSLISGSLFAFAETKHNTGILYYCFFMVIAQLIKKRLLINRLHYQACSSLIVIALEPLITATGFWIYLDDLYIHSRNSHLIDKYYSKNLFPSLSL